MGGATSANQYEGAYLEDGKGLSNVDLIPSGSQRLDVARGELDPKLYQIQLNFLHVLLSMVTIILKKT